MSQEFTEAPVDNMSVPIGQLPDLDGTPPVTDQGMTFTTTETTSVDDVSFPQEATEEQGGPAPAATSTTGNFNFADRVLTRTVKVTSLY